MLRGLTEAGYNFAGWLSNGSLTSVPYHRVSQNDTETETETAFDPEFDPEIGTEPDMAIDSAAVAAEEAPSTPITPQQSRSLKQSVSKKAGRLHSSVPYVRKLPLPVIGIIAAVAAVNIIVWIAVGIILHFHSPLASTAVLAYTLGLRHALDADHIAAIDLMTRRLVAAGQRPLTVGMFFSLGHSTIVIITSIAVAATAAAVSNKFDRYGRVGGIIGTSVSAAFLLLLGMANIYILYKLVQQMRKLLATLPGEEEGIKIQGGGVLFRLFKKMFKLINRPWKMYPLGVLFGLGFDTSSEVALLGIASIQGAKGTSIWLILIFPLLFTAGMCLLDTTDGALMMTLYTSTALARDRIAILYYSIVLTLITVVVAVFIGIVQLLNLILNVAEPTGKFWDGVGVLGDHYDIVGGAICGSFVVFGALSVLLYKPWRRRVDARRQRLLEQAGYSPYTNVQSTVLSDQEPDRSIQP